MGVLLNNVGHFASVELKSKPLVGMTHVFIIKSYIFFMDLAR